MTQSRHDNPRQPSLVFDGYEPPLKLRLSEHTRRIGLKHIAKIKAQLAEQAARERDNAIDTDRAA
jgi:hypothetical protein